MKKFLATLSGFAAVAVLAVVPLASAVVPANTVVVTGDTAAGENQPGWMFNRDASTATPFQFVQGNASIGAGSIYVPPIGANASDKFIAENFLLTPISEVNSISYDFKEAGTTTPTSYKQFYLNVYANFGESSPTKFYDCRYNIVPTSGSSASYTTVNFDPTLSYSVTRSGSSPKPTCPASPADMNLQSPGSTIRAIAINLGDTSTVDTGLGGYFDKVVVDKDSGTTTYDFEKYYPTNGQIISPTVGEDVSGTLNLSATYDDGDNINDDGVQWAVRAGTCAAGTGTVFGNVDGKSTPYNWDGKDFTATIDVSTTTPGSYCFIFNPSDDPGENNVRETVTFNIVEPGPVIVTPATKDDCKKGGFANFTDANGNPFKNQGLCVAYVASAGRAVANFNQTQF